MRADDPHGIRVFWLAVGAPAVARGLWFAQHVLEARSESPDNTGASLNTLGTSAVVALSHSRDGISTGTKGVFAT